MSIINKMLQDLEARGGLKEKSAFVPEKLDKLAPQEINEEASNRSNFLIISGLMVLVYLGVYFWVKTPSTPAQPVTDNQLLAQQNAQPAAQPNTETPTDPQEKLTDNNLAETEAQLSVEERVALHNAKAEKLRETAKNTQSEVASESMTSANNVALNHDVKLKENTKEEPALIEPTPAKQKPTPTVEAVKAPQTVKHRPNKIAKKPAIDVRPQPTLKSKEVKIVQNNIIKRVRPEQLSNNLYQEALTLIQQGRDINAQNKLADALIAYPENHDARQTLAALLLEGKQITGAKNVLQKGIEVTPSHNDFRMAVARLEIELNDQQAALKTLLDGDQYARNNVSYQSFLATVLQRNERHNEAIKHFNDALNLDRTMGNAYVGLGVSLQALNRKEEAKIAFEKAQQTHTVNEALQTFIHDRLQELNQTVSAR